MTNPLQHLYADFNTGDPAEKYANLADFPRMLDIELTSSCNFRCLMCPTGNRSLGRAAEFMSDDTMVNIAEQSVDHIEAIRFIGWGEPTTHPNLAEAIEGFSHHGILTHVNTNGSKMTPELALGLCSAGLDSIKFSFQGVDKKSYAEMRNIDFYDGMIEAIEVMREARGSNDPNVPFSPNRPWIAASTTTTWETPEMIEAFIAQIGPQVDELSIGKTIFDYMDLEKVRLRKSQVEMLHKLKDASTGDQKAHPDPCPEVFGKLSVHCDGSVVLCCNDYAGAVELGNVNNAHLVDMWRHPKIEAYRERLANKNYDAPLCKSCFNYMDLG